MPQSLPFRIAGRTIKRGETADIKLKVSERYTGDPISLPIRVMRAKRPGPTVFVTAAIHGEELNGVGVIHELMYDDDIAGFVPDGPINLTAGTLMLVPIVNIFGFETQSRYMPDRRDLNRSFPGFPNGSLTSRIASIVFREVVQRCEFGIDLHTAAAGRTNFPNIRGDLSKPGVRRLAESFGCELMVNGKGPDGSFRREAVKAGCSVITVEAGEPLKIEPSVLEVGVRGVRNVLIELGMTTGKPTKPAYQLRINKSTWVRADVGGILRFHVSPGQIVAAGQPIATNASVIGQDRNVLTAPTDGVVLGMTTLPTVKPGEPVCHLAVPGRSLRAIAKRVDKLKATSLAQRIRTDLATNISVTEREAEPPAPADLEN
jgi:predicted deacylase